MLSKELTGEFEWFGPLIFFALAIGVHLVMVYFLVKSRRRADEICQELVAQHWNELKLLSDGILIQTKSFNQKGILAMLSDRIIFIPSRKGERVEIPFLELTRMEGDKFFLFENLNRYGRKLVLYRNQTKLQFYINPVTYTAWKTAIEMMAPMVQASISMPRK